MTLTTTSKIALAGAAMVTAIAIAIAANPGPDAGDVSINMAPPPPPPPPAKVWDPASKGFLDALTNIDLFAVDVTDDDDATDWVGIGNTMCGQFAQPDANKEAMVDTTLNALKSGRDAARANGATDVPRPTREQATALVEAANSNLCPQTVMPLTAPSVDVPRVNAPNVPNPPRVSSGGGGSKGGESRFCRKRWWC
ncbi:MAG: DUF732 domain-containing protein [Actinobacteria bacterium]|nr:DUF732 domain-containing protein [Actinomycetota bacterium]